MIFLYIDPGSGYTFLNLGAGLLAFLAGVLGVALLYVKRMLGFIGRHKGPCVIIFLIILALLVTGISTMKTSKDFNKRMIVLGMDALSPEIMEPMMKAGRLPNFSRLAQTGAYSRLATTNPAQSPVAWAAFATGKNPGESGVFDFIVRDPKTYALDLTLSKMQYGRPVSALKAKGFWDYTSARKVNTVVLGCPDTFPPHKIHGKMLSGMGVPDILGTQGTFTFYTSLPEEGRDVGGRVVQVDKAAVMKMDLIGPRVRDMDGSSRNATVPFQVTAGVNGGVSVEYAGKKIELQVGHWSDWSEVEFDMGPLRKVRGIYKMYLLETAPEFKLYVGPINFDPRQPLFPISYPQGYAGELAGSVGLYHTQGMPMDVWGLNEKRLLEQAFIEQVNDVWQQRTAIFEHELGRLENGVLFAYFEPVDIIQHMFWRYTDPGHPVYEASTVYGGEIERWYEKMDGLLGKVLKRLGPNDILVVLSDHGFGTFKRAVHLNSWLRQHGYLVLKDPSADFGGELFEDIDWSRTRAYAAGFGGIYINRVRREGQGIVKAGKDEQALKAEIVQGLKAWVDEKGGATVVKNVYYQEDISHGKYAKDAPDLVVGFNVGYRASWQTAMGGAPGALIEDNKKNWSGDHLFDPTLVPGVIFANRKIHTAPAIYDVTPTILKVAGYGADEIRKLKFDGTPLF
ncbi:MAG: alkaline phosphatase family protein [Candidatus Omnitrophica bacterium]|nr:alkaline phosphatase family protein [Candidatus Omnitrophota bacterium]